MKLGLVYPRVRYPSGDYPLGIAALAAWVRRETSWEVAICDTTWDPRLERVAEFYDRQRPDVVGIGMSTLMLGEGLEAARLARERGLPVFLGGPHVTVDPGALLALPGVDACVVGEGEHPTVGLLRMFEAGTRGPVPGAWVKGSGGEVWPGEQRQPVADLDQLPLPAWELLDMEPYLSAWGQLDSVRPGLRGVNLSGSRGCPFSCTFCQPVLDDMFGKKLRQRSAGHLVAEIVELKRRFGIDGFWFTDDTFTTNRRWVEAFCDELARADLDLLWGCTTRANLIAPDLMQRMVAVGLRKLGIGMESATERVREGVYGKGVDMAAVEQTTQLAHELGVQTLLFLMLGAPDETRIEMLQTVEAATRLPATEASFSLFVPIPGTDLHRDMRAAGVVMSSDYTDYDYYARQPFQGPISRRQLRLLQRWAYLRFYGHPARWRSLARTASDGAGLRSLLRKLRRIAPAGTVADGLDARVEAAARVVAGS